MMNIHPKPGFDWNHVTWGRPDAVRSALCSYCSASIPDDSVPLMMWKDDGHAAQFCDACQLKWWGLRSYDGPADDAD